VKIFIACLLLLAMVSAAAAQNQTTFRDASGRITGTVTIDSNGTKTFATIVAHPALTTTAPLRRP
jgi:hypothetical protein